MKTHLAAHCKLESPSPLQALCAEPQCPPIRSVSKVSTAAVRKSSLSLCSMLLRMPRSGGNRQEPCCTTSVVVTGPTQAAKEAKTSQDRVFLFAKMILSHILWAAGDTSHLFCASTFDSCKMVSAPLCSKQQLRSMKSTASTCCLRVFLFAFASAKSCQEGSVLGQRHRT